MTTNPPRIRETRTSVSGCVQCTHILWTCAGLLFSLFFLLLLFDHRVSLCVSPVYLFYMFVVSLIFVDDSYLLLLLPSYAKAFHIFKIEMNSSVTFSLCDSFLSSFGVRLLHSLRRNLHIYFFLSALSRCESQP